MYNGEHKGIICYIQIIVKVHLKMYTKIIQKY